MTKRKTTFLGIRLDRELRAALDMEARRAERSVSWIVVKLLREGLKKAETRTQKKGAA